MTHSHRLAPLINLDQHEFYSSLDNAGWRRCHRLDDNRSISQIRKSVKEVPPGQDLRLANFTCFKEWYHGFGNPRIEVFSWEIPTKGLSIATFTERSPSQIYNAWIFGAQSLGITCGYWQFSGSTRRFQGVQSQEAVSQWRRGTNWSMGEMGASKRRSGRVKSKIMPGHVQFTVLSWSYPFEISLVPKKSCVVYLKIPWLSSFSRWKEVKESKYYKARMGRRGGG